MRLLALSLFALAACGAPASSTHPRSPLVESTDEDIDRATGDACSWRYEDGDLRGPNADENEPFIVEVNVDNDGRADLVANVGQCGNWGDCMFVLLRACEAGGYEALFGPEYAQNITLGEREEGATFAPVYVHGRTAMAGCDVPTRQALRHESGAWTLGASCADGEGIWDEECEGPPPPRCDARAAISLKALLW